MLSARSMLVRSTRSAPLGGAWRVVRQQQPIRPAMTIGAVHFPSSDQRSGGRAFSSASSALASATDAVMHNADHVGQVTAVATEPWAVVQGVQTAIEALHTTTGLPWWATLAMTGVGFRACMFPLYVYQIRASQRLMQARSDFKKIWSAYKYARTFLPSSDQRGHLQAILIARRGANFVMDKYNTRPVQTMLGSLLNIPIFFLVAYSARDMIRSGNFEGLQTGGLWIWANMMEPDSTYVLPIVACASTYLNQEILVRKKTEIWREFGQALQYLPILALPFCATLPQGVFFYWIGASWAMMGQSLLMDNNAVRRKLGLRPRISAPAKPATADVAAGSASVDKSAEVSVKDKHNA